MGAMHLKCDMAGMVRQAIGQLPIGSVRAGLEQLLAHITQVRRGLASEGDFLDFYMIRPETIRVGATEYRRFIHHPEPVEDGTVRCIGCGQIDEHPYHDAEICCEILEARRGG